MQCSHHVVGLDAMYICTCMGWLLQVLASCYTYGIVATVMGWMLQLWDGCCGCDVFLHIMKYVCHCQTFEFLPDVICLFAFSNLGLYVPYRVKVFSSVRVLLV